jgi:hypothetical protein
LKRARETSISMFLQNCSTLVQHVFFFLYKFMHDIEVHFFAFGEKNQITTHLRLLFFTCRMWYHDRDTRVESFETDFHFDDGNYEKSFSCAIKTGEYYFDLREE